MDSLRSIEQIEGNANVQNIDTRSRVRDVGPKSSDVAVGEVCNGELRQVFLKARAGSCWALRRIHNTTSSRKGCQITLVAYATEEKELDRLAMLMLVYEVWPNRGSWRLFVDRKQDRK